MKIQKKQKWTPLNALRLRFVIEAIEQNKMSVDTKIDIILQLNDAPIDWDATAISIECVSGIKVWISNQRDIAKTFKIDWNFNTDWRLTLIGLQSKSNS